MKRNGRRGQLRLLGHQDLRKMKSALKTTLLILAITLTILRPPEHHWVPAALPELEWRRRQIQFQVFGQGVSKVLHQEQYGWWRVYHTTVWECAWKQQSQLCIWIQGLPPPWVWVPIPCPRSWVFAISNTINTSICIRDSLNIFNLPQWGIPWNQMHICHCCFHAHPHTGLWHTLRLPYCPWGGTSQTACQRTRICMCLLHSSPGNAAGTEWCSVLWCFGNR